MMRSAKSCPASECGDYEDEKATTEGTWEQSSQADDSRLFPQTACLCFASFVAFFRMKNMVSREGHQERQRTSTLLCPCFRRRRTRHCLYLPSTCRGIDSKMEARSLTLGCC